MALEKNNVVVVERVFAAPAQKVFAALKEGRLFFNCGAWPTKTTIDFKVGGKYRLDFAQYGITHGEFTEIVADRRVAFTWNSDEMEVRSRVTIDLAPDAAGTKAKLRHEGFADRETAESHEGGWTSAFDDLDRETLGHRVHVDREFLVPVEMLFDACAGMNLFSNMGATAANSKVDFRVGGRYSLNLEKGTLHGEFLEIVKNQRIVMTWDGVPCDGKLEKPTRVTMEFGPYGDGGKNSYLELIHEGFTKDEQTLLHHGGWNSVFEKIRLRAAK